MASLFNQNIIFPQCKDCNGDMYKRDQQGNIEQKNGIDVRCSCYIPWKYFNANIGFEYWLINEKNFQGDINDLNKVSIYFDKIHKLKSEGRGFYISGSGFGTGKTSIATIFAKKVLETTNYSVLFLPCSELVITGVKYMQTYNPSYSEKMDYIKDVDFLVIDDLGKEFDDNKDWSRATLNSILRYRASWRKITIFTSNIEIDKLSDLYGGSNYSLIAGYSIVIPMNHTTDHRKTNKIKQLINDKKSQKEIK